MELIPNLGLVVDLTNTTKYYSPGEFESKNIVHVKVFTEGKQIPNAKCYTKYVRHLNVAGATLHWFQHIDFHFISNRFHEAVKKFYDENKDNGMNGHFDTLSLV